MIGRKVKRWCGMTGEVIKWEPLGTGMCDALVREDTGRECWYSSTDLKPIDGDGPLPRRDVMREWARLIAIDDLREIRAQLIRDWRKPWLGAEHGKAIVGNCINGALEDLLKEG